MSNNSGLSPLDQIKMANEKAKKEDAFRSRFETFFNSTTKTLEDILLEQWQMNEYNRTISNAVEHAAYDIDDMRKVLHSLVDNQKKDQKSYTTPLLLGYQQSTESMTNAIVSAISSTSSTLSGSADDMAFANATPLNGGSEMNPEKLYEKEVKFKKALLFYVTDISESVKTVANYYHDMMRSKKGTTGKPALGDLGKDKDTGGGFGGILGAIGSFFAFTQLRKLIKALLKTTGKKILNGFSGFISKIGGFLLKPFTMLLEKFPIIGKIFRPLEGLFAPILKFFGKNGIKAVPLIGEVVAAIMAIWDFFDGFSDAGASELLGKSKDKLSIWDKVTSGITSVISGLLLGFVDKKTILPYVQKVERVISELWGSFVKMLPDKFKGFISNLVSGSVDFGKYVIAFVKNIIPNILEFISSKSKDISGALEDAGGVTGLIGSLLEKVTTFMSEVIDGLIKAGKDFINDKLGVLSPFKDSDSKVESMPKVLDPSTSKQTQDLEVARIAAQNSQNGAPSVVAVPQSSSANKQSVDRAVSNGRDESNRAIGGNRQFAFGQ